MAYQKLRPDEYAALPWEAKIRFNNFGERWIGTRKFGYNENVGTSFEDVWVVGGNISFLSAADTMDVVSDDAADTNSAGTGLRKVRLQGLDGDYNFVDEVVDLAGTTPVTTTNSFIRVFRAFSVETGSGEVNAGVISITDTTGGSDQAQILAGDGQTLQAIYTTRAGYYGYVTGVAIGIGGDDVAITQLRTRAPTEGFRVRDQSNIAAGGISQISLAQWCGGILVPPKTDIIVRSKKIGSGGTTSVSAAFSVFEIREEEVNV